MKMNRENVNQMLCLFAQRQTHELVVATDCFLPHSQIVFLFVFCFIFCPLHLHS